MPENTIAKAVYTVNLLSGSAYIWYSTQHFAIRMVQVNLGALLDYAYQTQVALPCCKQSGDVASYSCIFF